MLIDFQEVMRKAFDKTKKQNTLKSQTRILSKGNYEKEIYICVEDILMYAIEKRIINVMKGDHDFLFVAISRIFHLIIFLF